MSAQAWMLGSRAQKWLKGIHVTFVVFSVGGILSMLVLLLLKQSLKGGENLFLIDLGIFRLLNFLNYSFYGVMLTGPIYSLFTKWGFFRHHWITVKWIVVLLLFICILHSVELRFACAVWNTAGQLVRRKRAWKFSSVRMSWPFSNL